MEAPLKFRKSEPKEPRVYRKAGKCPIHKTVKLKKDDHECCDCCCGGGCDPKYTCPKCEKIYNEKYTKWFRKWGHTCAVWDDLHAKNRRLITMQGLRFMQFYNGGKTIKMGSWARLDENGILRASRKNKSTILVIS